MFKKKLWVALVIVLLIGGLFSWNKYVSAEEAEPGTIQGFFMTQALRDSPSESTIENAEEVIFDDVDDFKYMSLYYRNALVEVYDTEAEEYKNKIERAYNFIKDNDINYEDSYYDARKAAGIIKLSHYFNEASLTSIENMEELLEKQESVANKFPEISEWVAALRSDLEREKERIKAEKERQEEVASFDDSRKEIPDTPLLYEERKGDYSIYHVRYKYISSFEKYDDEDYYNLGFLDGSTQSFKEALEETLKDAGYFDGIDFKEVDHKYEFYEGYY